MYLTSQSLDDSTLPLHEKWYKIQYKTEKYDDKLMADMKTPQVNDSMVLDLPPPNTLLPTNFDLLAEDSKLSDRPRLLQIWDDTEVWYKKDDKFKRPKGIVSMKLYTNDNQFSSTTQGRLFVEVWNQCLTEVTREFAYMADCAGLSFSSTMYTDNVGFEWSGYNSSLPVFIKETIDIL
jgi:secreted Zn-dependent insulinase-like peptidase